MKAFSLSACVFSATVSGSALAGLVVDGNLADWQIDPRTWVSSLPGVHSAIEDQTGSGDYYLNPGYGGQAYDAEAMYAVLQEGKLFIALATGHNPLTIDAPGNNVFGAGDFAIDFGLDGSYELGINVVNNFDGGVLGGVYRSPVWDYGLWDANGQETHDPDKVDKTHPTSLLGGTFLGLANYSYTTTGVTGYGSQQSDKHYFYEISLDLSLLSLAGWDGNAFNIHWTQNCANDNILVDPEMVPEPGSLALLGIGMIGLLGGGLRRSSLRQKHCQQAV
jgi:hypothetical protein